MVRALLQLPLKLQEPSTIHTHTYMDAYPYICINRGRERDIYIYIHTYLHIYIYIDMLWPCSSLTPLPSSLVAYISCTIICKSYLPRQSSC